MASRSSLLGYGLAEDKIVLGYVFGLLGLSLFVLGHFFLLDIGLGPSMRWAGVVKFFDPIGSISVIFMFHEYFSHF